MPRSVNAVASRARRKKMMKHAKGSLGVEKMYGQLPKMLLKKHGNMRTEIEKIKREVFVHFGLYG